MFITGKLDGNLPNLNRIGAHVNDVTMLVNMCWVCAMKFPRHTFIFDMIAFDMSDLGMTIGS